MTATRRQFIAAGAEARRLRRGGPVVLQVAVSARGADGMVRVASRKVRLR